MTDNENIELEKIKKSKDFLMESLIYEDLQKHFDKGDIHYHVLMQIQISRLLNEANLNLADLRTQ